MGNRKDTKYRQNELGKSGMSLTAPDIKKKYVWISRGYFVKSAHIHNPYFSSHIRSVQVCSEKGTFSAWATKQKKKKKKKKKKRNIAHSFHIGF